MEWPLTADEIAAKSEVFRLDTPTGRARVNHAMLSRFSAHDGRNPSVARSAERFLTESARDDRTTHVRTFVIDEEIAGFYALSVGEATVTSKQRRRLAARATNDRIPTAHVDWIARHREAPPGTGGVVLGHALAYVKDELQPVAPILAVTLDPYDQATAAMWDRMGFRATSTKLHGGLTRRWFPLTGYATKRLDVS